MTEEGSNGGSAAAQVAAAFAEADARRREELDRAIAREGKRSPRGGRSADGRCSICRVEPVRKDNGSGVCYRCRAAPARGRAVASGEAPVVKLEGLTEAQLRKLMDGAAAELRKRRTG